MAAAAERLGDAGHVDPRARAEADLHAAARLLHEEQADLDAVQAARVVDQVLAVLRHGAGRLVIALVDLRKRHPAAVGRCSRPAPGRSA